MELELPDILALDDAVKASDWRLMSQTSMYKKLVDAAVRTGRPEKKTRADMDKIMKEAVESSPRMTPEMRLVVLNVILSQAKGKETR